MYVGGHQDVWYVLETHWHVAPFWKCISLEICDLNQLATPDNTANRDADQAGTHSLPLTPLECLKFSQTNRTQLPEITSTIARATIGWEKAWRNLTLCDAICSVVGCWINSCLLGLLAEAYNYQSTNMETQSLLKHMPCHKPMCYENTEEFAWPAMHFRSMVATKLSKAGMKQWEAETAHGFQEKENNPSSCYNQLPIEALMVGHI